jgi:hypothetical protein
MRGHVAALQLQPVDGIGGLALWAGVVVLGLALIVWLLDWGPLSHDPGGRWPVHRTALALAIAGAVLLAVGIAGWLLGR